MIYEVIISKQADYDLRGIYEHIAYELQSPQNASGQLERLEGQINALSQMPNRFRQYEKEPWHNRGLHMMPVDNYIVLYISDEEKRVVTIVRVLYGRRNIEAQLR